MKTEQKIETPATELRSAVKRSNNTNEDNEHEPVAKRARSLNDTTYGNVVQTNKSSVIDNLARTSKEKHARKKRNSKRNNNTDLSDTGSTTSVNSRAQRMEYDNNTSNHAINFINVAIVDNSSYNGIIDSTKLLLIEEKIILAMATQNPTADEIQFNGNSWYNGYKIIKCGSQEAYNFLKKIVHNMGELWPGASLDLVPKCFLHISTNVKVYVPPPFPINDATMLKLLERQNKHLNVFYWKILNTIPANNGRIYTFAVDRLSMGALKKNLNIRYGLNVLRANLTKSSSRCANAGV